MFGSATDMDLMYEVVMRHLCFAGDNLITDYSASGDIVRRFIGASSDDTRFNTLVDLQRSDGGGWASLVLASGAFGMGVNIPTIRRVVHWGLPRSLDAYWQESGRGSRDGKGCVSCVVIGPTDRSNATSRRTSHAMCTMFGLSYGTEPAPSIGCRRAHALHFFGDSASEIVAGTPSNIRQCCDLCADRLSAGSH